MIEMEPKSKTKLKDGILVPILISCRQKIRKVLERSYEFIFDFYFKLYQDNIYDLGSVLAE